MPDPSLNVTLHGIPGLWFISLLPKPAMPFCAGNLQRLAADDGNP